MRMRLLALTLLLLVGSSVVSFGQRQDTTYQVLDQNSTSTSLSRTLGPVTNIGQSSHQVVFQLINKPTFTCDTTVVGFYVLVLGNYANDSATSVQLPYSQFEATTNVTANGISVILQANNAYPFIWVQLVFTTADFTNCIYNLYYTGTIAPGVVTTSNVYGNIGYREQNNVLGMGANLLFVTGATDRRYTKMYRMVISATTATDIAFSCNGGTSVMTVSIPAEATLDLPFDNIWYFSCAKNAAFTATASTATATMHSWYLFLHTPF